MSKIDLNETVFGIFYDVGRHLGATLNSAQIEGLRGKSGVLAEQLKTMIRKTSIEVAEQIQKATTTGFERTTKRFSDQQEHLAALAKVTEDTNTNLLELNRKLTKELDECRSSLQEQLTDISKHYTTELSNLRREFNLRQTGSSARGASVVGRTRIDRTKPVEEESETSLSSTTSAGRPLDEPSSSPDPTKTTSGSKTEPEGT